jgi:predicted CoA-binding protein
MTDDTFRDPAVIERVLADTSVWAIVGLGDDPEKTAYQIAAFLQRHGKRIVPVHPRGGEVLGEPGFTSLAEIPFAIDVVDIFRRSSDAGRFVDEAIALHAKAVWLQLGVVDADAASRAKAAGLDVVMDTCPKIEWPRHGPHTAATSPTP